MAEPYRIRQFQKGSVVVVQGQDNPGVLHVVKSGSLKIDSEHKLKDRILSGFEKGDSFGLVSALTSRKYLVTIYAATDAELIEIPLASLGYFLKEKPDFTLRLFRVYSRELKALNRHLSRTSATDFREATPDNLIADASLYLEWNRPDLAACALQRFRSLSLEERASPVLQEEIRSLEKRIGIPFEPPTWEGISRKVMAGEILFLENERSSEIYVVQSGAVRLFRIVRNREYIIDILGPGEIFGEMALLDHSCRNGSAVAEKDSEILRLDTSSLFSAVGHAVLQRIAEGLARRIWFSHQRMVILKIPDPVTRIYAFLYNLIRDDLIKRKEFTRGFKYDDSCSFPLSFDELLVMCGIIRIDPEKLRIIRSDPNLKWNEDSLMVVSSRNIKDKISYLRGNTGQIAADIL